MTNDRFAWEADDIVVNTPSAVALPDWTLTFRWEGATQLVVDHHDLCAYLIQNNPTGDLQTMLDDWVSKLTSTQVESMPDNLRDELLDQGYELP